MMHPNDPNYHDPHENWLCCYHCDDPLVDQVSGHAYERTTWTPDGRVLCRDCAREIDEDARNSATDGWSIGLYSAIEGIKEAASGCAFHDSWELVGTMCRWMHELVDESDEQLAEFAGRRAA